MKKEQIIESARALFIKYGYKKVSMSEIAENAGVTKRTLYSYFRDKEDLLNYFLEEEVKKTKKMIQSIEKKKLEFFETIHQVLFELFKHKKKDKLLVILSKEAENVKMEAVKNSLKKLDDSIQNYISEKLQRAKDNGYIRVSNIEMASFLIYKLYISLMFEWNSKTSELDEKELSDNIISILKNGMLKERK